MRKLGLSILLLLSFSFSSCKKTPEKGNFLNYLEKILGQAPNESRRYVLISDYSCSACKEQTYREIEGKFTDDVYVILQPRNKAILLDRFQEAIYENRLFIDTAKLNIDMGIVMDKTIEISLKDGKWELRELDEVF